MQSVVYNLKPMLYNLKLNKDIIAQSKEDMVEESKGTKKIKPEVLISRFRSKEDLYRYLTQQGKRLKHWWLRVQWTCFSHQCMVLRWASCATFWVRASHSSNKMRSTTWRCPAIKRSPWRTSTRTRWRMNCFRSISQLRNSYRAGSLNVDSSSACCVPCEINTWGTSSRRHRRPGTR